MTFKDWELYFCKIKNSVVTYHVFISSVINETEDTFPLYNINSLNNFILKKKKVSFTNTLNTLSLFQKTRS